MYACGYLVFVDCFGGDLLFLILLLFGHNFLRPHHFSCPRIIPLISLIHSSIHSLSSVIETSKKDHTLNKIGKHGISVEFRPRMAFVDNIHSQFYDSNVIDLYCINALDYISIARYIHSFDCNFSDVVSYLISFDKNWMPFHVLLCQMFLFLLYIYI